MDATSDIVVEVEQYLDKKITDSDYDMTLKELGLDSLDVMDFVFSLEKKMNIQAKIEDAEIDTLTLKKIISFFKNKS
jgi:acyl carrier protein